MKLKFRSVLLLLCVVSLPGTGSAQTCLGAAQFSAGMVRLGASASFTDGTKSYGGELAVGATTGLFVSGNAGQISYNGESAKSTVIGANLGYSIAVGSTAQFCPLVSYSHITFPDVNVGFSTITSSGNNVGFGGALGMVETMSPEFNLVPHIGAEYIHASVSASSLGFGSQNSSEDYGVLSLGVGLVIDKALTLSPNVAVPIGLTGGKVSFGIGVALNFGHSGSSPLRVR